VFEFAGISCGVCLLVSRNMRIWFLVLRSAERLQISFNSMYKLLYLAATKESDMNMYDCAFVS
jgi:hypothetical protein